MCKECLNCPRRSIEPNCHNPDTCEHWAKHLRETEERHKREAERRLLRGSEARYSKSHDIYIKGEFKKGRRVGG